MAFRRILFDRIHPIFVPLAMLIAARSPGKPVINHEARTCSHVYPNGWGRLSRGIVATGAAYTEGLATTRKNPNFTMTPCIVQSQPDKLT